MPSQEDPWALLDLCKQRLREEQANEALRSAQDAQAIFEARGDTVGHADASRAVVGVMLKLGRVDEALTAAREGLTAIRRSGERSLATLRRREAPLLLATAEALVEKREAAQAATPATQAQRFYRSLGDTRGEGEAQLTLARVQLLQDKTGDAVVAAEAARGLLEGWDRLAALRVMLDAHGRASNHSAVVKTAEAARQLCEELGDSVGVGQMLHETARAQLEGGQPDEALNSARRAMHHFSEAGRRQELAAATMSVARAHVANQEHSHATIMAKEASSMFKALGDRKGQADAENELSQILIQVGDIGEATRHAEVAHTIYKELQDAEGRKDANMMLCTLELAPDMIELRQSKVRGIIRRVVRAVSSRDAQACELALHDLERPEYKGMFSITEVKTALEPLMTADPTGTTRFVRANAGSWSELANLEPPKNGGLKDWTLRFFDD